jgi:hypothetical protein
MLDRSSTGVCSGGLFFAYLPNNLFDGAHCLTLSLNGGVITIQKVFN